jgi:nicotinic acid mononucleotide adenylyltransferase
MSPRSSPKPTRSSPRDAASSQATAPITPLPLTPAAVRALRRVYVYGGSFDPPHEFHITAVRIALKWLGEAREGDTSGILLYVPAAQSPLKDHAPSVSDEHRIAMLRDAQLGSVRNPKHARGREPFGFVWTDEIDRATFVQAQAALQPALRDGNDVARGVAPAASNSGAVSYTIDTIRRLRTLLPKECSVRLIIGADQALQLHKWKDARELVSLAPPLLLPRGEFDSPQRIALGISRADAQFWTQQEIGSLAMSLLPVYSRDVSSTRLREQLAGPGRAKLLASGELVGDVVEYIKKHKLYLRAKPAAKPEAMSGSKLPAQPAKGKAKR